MQRNRMSTHHSIMTCWYGSQPKSKDQNQQTVFIVNNIYLYRYFEWLNPEMEKRHPSMAECKPTTTTKTVIDECVRVLSCLVFCMRTVGYNRFVFLQWFLGSFVCGTTFFRFKTKKNELSLTWICVLEVDIVINRIDWLNFVFDSILSVIIYFVNFCCQMVLSRHDLKLSWEIEIKLDEKRPFLQNLSKSHVCAQFTQRVLRLKLLLCARHVSKS